MHLTVASGLLTQFREIMKRFSLTF